MTAGGSWKAFFARWLCVWGLLVLVLGCFRTQASGFVWSSVLLVDHYKPTGFNVTASGGADGACAPTPSDQEDKSGQVAKSQALLGLYAPVTSHRSSQTS
jgi:hypothetical protein